MLVRYILKAFASLTVFCVLILSCSKPAPDDPNSGAGTGTGTGNGPGTGPGSGSSGSTTPPTTSSPSTILIASQDYSVSNFGAYRLESFTINKTTTLSFRLSTLYKVQAAIIVENQVNAFKNMQAFAGFALFDNTFGTKTVTLNAGAYYVAIRNTTNGQNKWSLELDSEIILPSSDRATRYDYYLNDTKAYANGGKTWQPFTIQSGLRYFLDGCNVNTDFFIIPESELTKFQNNQSFNSYTDYNSQAGEAPGLYEIKLNPGTYYLVSRSNQTSSFTYTMERWKVN